MQVLTDYFNEKESQLQKWVSQYIFIFFYSSTVTNKSYLISCFCREISAKEKLYMESENKDQLLSQKLSSLKEEIKNNKYVYWCNVQHV